MTKAQVARASRIAALVAALVGFADTASAQRPSEQQIAAIRQTCRSDYIAHCAGIPPGGAQALACLREHLASVSPPCQQAVNAAGAAASPAPAAQTPAPPPAAAAPESPSAAPAPAVAGKAAAALERMRPNTEQVGIILQACGADIGSHCAAAERGPGWELKCLRDNAASLSAGCEQVLLAIASTAPAEPAAAPAAAPPAAPAAAAPPAPPAPAAAAPAPAPAPAAAQRARPSREQIVMILRACRGDMREHCAGAEGGPGSRIECLRDNAANLSPGCRQTLAAVVSGAPAEPAAGAPAGPPPAAAAPPRERPVSPRQVLFLIRTACDGDFRTYCRGVQFGGGRVIGCLRENAANLSPRCRQAFMSLVGGR